MSVAAGFGFSLALKRDGTVIGWGYNTLVAIAAGGHILALLDDSAPSLFRQLTSNRLRLATSQSKGLRIILPAIDRVSESFTFLRV